MVQRGLKQNYMFILFFYSVCHIFAVLFVVHIIVFCFFLKKKGKNENYGIFSWLVYCMVSIEFAGFVICPVLFLRRKYACSGY